MRDFLFVFSVLEVPITTPVLTFNHQIYPVVKAQSIQSIHSQAPVYWPEGYIMILWLGGGTWR